MVNPIGRTPPVRQRASRRSRVRASPRVVRFWLEYFRFWLGFVCQNHSNTSHIGLLRVRAGRGHNIPSSACSPPLSFLSFLGVFRSFGTAPVLLASFGVGCAVSCRLTTVLIYPKDHIQTETNERKTECGQLHIVEHTCDAMPLFTIASCLLSMLRGTLPKGSV